MGDKADCEQRLDDRLCRSETPFSGLAAESAGRQSRTNSFNAANQEASNQAINKKLVFRGALYRKIVNECKKSFTIPLKKWKSLKKYLSLILEVLNQVNL